MSMRIKLLAGVLVAACVAGLAWLWNDKLELRWETRTQLSDAARENQMLGATLLLRQRGYQVDLAGTLGALNLHAIPAGTLIVGNEHGVTTPESAQLLLAWVQRGNTLIFSPRWANSAERAALRASAAPGPHEKDNEDEDDEEDPAPARVPPSTKPGPVGARPAPRPRPPPPAALVETDPLGAYFGVRRKVSTRLPKCSKEHEKASAGTAHVHTSCVVARDFKPAISRLTLPGGRYPLTIGQGEGAMVQMAGAPAPLWTDEQAEVLRVYGEGKGRVVLMAGNYFGNANLQQYDHAELLLGLAALNPDARTVTLVRSLDALPWYVALWRHFQSALIALACCLALLFWMAVRRFGPLLPQAGVERRSLMEHIAASGAWLWKAEGGRQLLLAAAREDTLALLRRRAPALFRLPSQALPAALARATGLDQEQLSQALQDDCARQPARFTRQIRTLQELRNHYER